MTDLRSTLERYVNMRQGNLLDSAPGFAALLGGVVGELFDVLGDVSRLIGRLVSQPAELVGILVDVRGGPTAT